MLDLHRQSFQQGAGIVRIQELRVPSTAVREAPFYAVLGSPADSAGSYGCHIWLRASKRSLHAWAFIATLAHVLDMSHRHVTANVEGNGWKLLASSFHAASASPQWWHAYSSQLHLVAPMAAISFWEVMQIPWPVALPVTQQGLLLLILRMRMASIFTRYYWLTICFFLAHLSSTGQAQLITHGMLLQVCILVGLILPLSPPSRMTFTVGHLMAGALNRSQHCTH